MTDAETARWAKATRIAEGITDYGTGKALRTYFLLYLPLGMLLLTGIGFLVSFLVFGNLREEWPLHLTMGLSLSSAGTLIGGFVYAGKKVNPQVRPQRSGALIWLDKPERKDILRQIHGRIPPAPEHLALTRGAAAQLRQGLALQLLIAPGYLLMAAAQTLNAPGSVLNLLWIPLGGIFLALLIVAGRQFRQAGRFLDRAAASVTTGSP